MAENLQKSLQLCKTQDKNISIMFRIGGGQMQKGQLLGVTGLITESGEDFVRVKDENDIYIIPHGAICYVQFSAV
jgi:hypothetical protein